MTDDLGGGVGLGGLVSVHEHDYPGRLPGGGMGPGELSPTCSADS